MILNDLNVEKLTNEQLVKLKDIIAKEEERRIKIDKRNAAIQFREALGNFIDSGACYDFAVVCCLDTGDADVIFYEDSYCSEGEVDTIEFNPFNREVLLVLKNELTRRIGNYEG